jgi:hypothetical protein
MDYDDGEVKATIEVKRATFGDELIRSQMLVNAMPENGEDVYTYNMRSAVQANLRAGTKSAQISRAGVEIVEWWASDQLLTLPGELINDWLADIYAVNPHWDPARKPSKATLEKKVSTSTAA